MVRSSDLTIRASIGSHLTPPKDIKPQLKMPQFTSALATTHGLEEIRVDMACMKIGNRSQWLVTNVGSCVALCIYDQVNKCGGMAHIMLPDGGRDKEILPCKYADTAVPTLISAIRNMSGEETRLIAKMAGGASMFYDSKYRVTDIGPKNVEAVKKALENHNVPLVACDVGGKNGRRVSFNVFTGVMIVRTLNGVERVL
ncbi:MAG: chemotaxis protein CheD [Candidatus Bathyarchaeia archaeon]